MKIKNTLSAGLLLSTFIIPAHAQLPIVGDLLGGNAIATAPVQLLGLAKPVLGVLDQGVPSLVGLIPGGASLPLIDTLAELPSAGTGLLGVAVPLGSGVIIGGGLPGLIGLGSGLPVIGDLLQASNNIPLVGDLLDIPLL